MLPAGLAGIRTNQSQHVRSVPPSHRSAYVERHILAKHKELMEKQIALFERKLEQCRNQLADIEAQLQVAAQQEKREAYFPPAARRPAPNRMAKMTLEY